ncbi:MAG1360 family OppF-related protein [Mycoplasma seminis]|uniref:ABC transporter ATP-binding protein n=1 Tax=Mycoplasma seminis TaxID=512749 RepID=A0ABY9HB83_9MOLU|nr:hypothetical protein [Mycoplasma seminis]WLP85797.1 hypothetical protein Q8852_01465 [Mycoplasma seminis]
MSKEHKILRIENIFVNKGYKKSKYTFWPETNISIPCIDLYHGVKTAFYVPDDNRNLVFSKIASFVLHDPNSAVTYFNPHAKSYFDFNKAANFTTKKKELLNKIAYFDISEIINQDDTNIPLYELWKDCLHSITHAANLTNLNRIYSNLDYTLKNIIFNILRLHSSNILDMNNEFLKTFQQATESYLKINNNDVQNKQNTLDNIIFLANNYMISVIKEYFELFKELKNQYRFLESEIQTSNINEQKSFIDEGKIRLAYMNQINNVSLIKVENDLKIRDLKTEINFYENLKNATVKYSKKVMIAEINLIRKEISLLEKKKHFLKNINEEYFDLLKDILIKRKELNIWIFNFDKLKYLNEKQLNNLKNEIDSEINIFINNNFTEIRNKYKNTTVKKIKDFISQEFSFNIKEYITISKNTAEEWNSNIRNNKKAIEAIKNKKYNHISDYKNIVDVHDLEEKIKYAQAELEWSKYSKEKLFNSLLKSKEFKLNRLKSNVKKTQRDISACLDKILKATPNKNEAYFSYILEIEKFKHFISTNWMFNLILLMISYASNKQKANKCLLLNSAAMIRFIESFETSSISIPNYIKPFKDLDVVDKAKIKLTKFSLDKIQILFIQDSLKQINEFEKSEFMRVLFKLIEVNDITTIFISSDLEVIKNSFDYVYFFNDMQLLEGGKVNEVLKKPINPDLKMLLKGKINSLNQQLNRDYVQLFIYPAIYYLDTQPTHFVYCTLNEYQTWTLINTNKLPQKQKEFNNTKLSDTLINDFFQSVFEGDEVILTQENTKFVPEPYDAGDKQFTKEIATEKNKVYVENISPEDIDKLF